MLGIVVKAEISAPSLACFFRGSHDSGTTNLTPKSKQAGNNYWIFHGAVFRCAWGHATAGEMIHPSSGIRTDIPKDHEHNPEAMVKPHREPMATTLEYQDQCILETETCDHLKPCTGADVFDVGRFFLAEVRVAVFHIQAYAWQIRIRKPLHAG